MSKRIAIIIERADVALGGAERSVFELASALSAIGAQVDILAAKGQRQDPNVRILCRDSLIKRPCYFTFAKKLIKYLTENQYDVVHSVLPFNFAHVYQPRGGTYAESVLRNTVSYENRPIEACKKATAFINFRRTMLLRAERKLCSQPNGPKVVAISQYVAEQFRRHYALPDERMVVIPNGIRIPAAANKDKTDRLRHQILTSLDVKETSRPVIFLFAANNFRLKGLYPLIRALRLATNHGRDNNAFLVVIGSGKPAKYERLAKKLKVHRKILFLGPVKNIQNIMSVSDVAVLPTFYDPCSRFILEALAANIPVITTRFNGATDMFIDGRHGRIIDSPQNVHSLAEAICYFTDTCNIEKASRAIAADNIGGKISIDRVARQLLSVYDTILLRKGGN